MRTNVTAVPARHKAGVRRRGTIAVIAMLYMLLLTTLALALYAAANNNVMTSENFSDITRAQAAAETGLRWMDFRFQAVARPQTDKGVVTTTVATTLWPTLRDTLAADLKTVKAAGGVAPIVKVDTNRVRAYSIAVDANTGATFDVTIRQLTTADKLYPTDPTDERYVRVITTGNYRRSSRTVSMDFQIDKKVKFAVVGKVPIQVGRNTIVDGPVGMSTANKYPPIYALSDFTHFHAGLKSKIDSWNTYLEGVGTVNGKVINNHDGYDNRISVNNTDEYKLATAAGYKDVNGDAYIDEYDLFLAQFDANKDLAISKAEFTNPATTKLYDPHLFSLIDNLSPPMQHEDKNNNNVLDAGEDMDGDGVLDKETARGGLNDGIIDNRDGYAKIRGQVTLATTAAAWDANLAPSGQEVHDMIRGPITNPDPTETAVKFGATTAEVFDLSPANFEQCTLSFKAKTGAAGGAVVSTKVNATSTPGSGSGTMSNKILSAADANGYPLSVDERTPYGSASWQATYRRPKFVNMTFTNVQIPKGLNALFDNCTFKGVTFVDMTRNITKPSSTTTTYDKNEGMTWSKRMRSGTFSNTTALTATNSYGFTDGNNVRFNDCKFEGPLIGAYATAYTHFTNSWEFTGGTVFDNRVDQTATLVAPQANIEMGSFDNPGASLSTLVGVVVAGNIDIRGNTTVDGSIIITGDGAGNTTLSFFGNNDGETNPGAMPGEAGYGKLYVRYNPNRVMPDGVLVPVDLTPQISSYREGAAK